MAFDAAMTAAVCGECNRVLTAARLDKISQPEKDEIVLTFRTQEGNRRLVISASNNNPHVAISERQKENPMTAPMFCMVLRKHLSSARFLRAEQPPFERVIMFIFESHDDMGFACEKTIVCEIMGKYSNIMLIDGNQKIIAPIKTVDFSQSQKRQVLPGMQYELPPAQDKLDPTTETEAGFVLRMKSASDDMRAEKWLVANYMGISPLLAREIVYTLCARTDAPLSALSATLLWRSLCAFLEKTSDPTPTLVKDENGKPVAFAYYPITQYGSHMQTETCATLGELCDRFFAERDHIDRVKQRASDIFKLLANAETRLQKKIDAQEAELIACAEGETYKKMGDLITSNIWQLSRGMEKAELIDYSDEGMPTVTVELDTRLSPAQNAQRYYKRYAKARRAEVVLREQIALAKAELAYLDTVFDALTRAEVEADLDEIRDELYHSGYASRMKQYAQRKKKVPKPMTFITSGGYRVLCGKNNAQNEYITHKLASKNDIWFHAKNVPGSHVVLFTNGTPMDDIPERDFTEAATVAAVYSKVGEAKNAPVDYTLIRQLKKPPQAKPGMVIYHTNWSAYVTPDEALVNTLREKNA